jgi:hypothetical protein
MEHNNTSAELGAKQAVPSAPARDRWRAILDEHRESGLGVAAFCRLKAIPTSSFYGWRQKLDATVRASAAKPPRRQRASFVRVKMAQAGADSTLPAAGSPVGPLAEREEASLAVVLRNGHRLLLGRGFDPQLLQQAVCALEGLA